MEFELACGREERWGEERGVNRGKEEKEVKMKMGEEKEEEK